MSPIGWWVACFRDDCSEPSIVPGDAPVSTDLKELDNRGRVANAHFLLAARAICIAVNFLIGGGAGLPIGLILLALHRGPATVLVAAGR